MKSEKCVYCSVCIVAAILCFVSGVAGYFIGAEICETWHKAKKEHKCCYVESRER